MKEQGDDTVNKGVFIIAFIVLIVFTGVWFLKRPLHQSISVKSVKSIEFWSQHNSDSIEPYQRKITLEEIKRIVTWFNSATDIRENKGFAGTTPICGIKINLKDGNEILILSSGEDFEVQRYISFAKRVSYWAKQPEIKKILIELGTEIKGETVKSSFSELEEIF